ncbi:MAG: InlB B-repeat-containing protein [Clostridia bacterium]|nr:InlB B-repeat-containing protein [Clostridia bacterium]
MKKIIIPIIICILLSLICFASCGDEAKNDTAVTAQGFQWNKDTASISVSSSIEQFSFLDKITVAENATYILASDEACQNEISSKTVSLNVGDNTYYILVTNGSEQKLYTFTIRRKPTYTVTFNTNGGSSIEAITVEEGASINNQSVAKTGYIHGGWTLNGEAVNFPYQVKSDIKLDAVFTPVKYEIQYFLNGGTNSSDNPQSYTIEDTVLLQAPTRENYAFVGWYANVDLSGETVEEISKGSTEKITLYAKWKTAYKIEYELNGGINNVSNPDTYAPEQEVVLSEPTREGYEFLGWYLDSGFRNKADKITLGSSGSKKFYAKWDAKENKLSFNSNGGTGIMAILTLYTDETAVLSKNIFKRQGYTFIGWSTTPNGDVEYIDSAVYKMGPKDTTLYAVWDENAPTDSDITLFNNGFTEYTIVYPKDNAMIENQVKSLAEYILSSYNIRISYKAVNKDEDVGDKEIIIGNVRNKVKFSTPYVAEVNDFILEVSGDDYVIYASNDNLYSYALRIFRDSVISKTSNKTLKITADHQYSYKSSEYKDISYLNYLKSNSGNYNKEILCELFGGFSYTASDGTVLPYRLYIPSSYDESKDYPVIVFLHGAGERGNDNQAQMGNMLPAMFNQQNTKFGEAIVIAPQCPGWPNQWVDTPWGDGNYSIDNVPESNELKAVVELLNTVKTGYSTDENRYYAMGISMGGFGTWDLIMRHPEMFAAAVPVCGGADVSQAENLKYMPIFTAHADNDGSVPFSGTRDMVKALKRAGSTSVIFKQRADGSLSSGGHIIWDEIGRSGEMMDWLFKQKRIEEPIPGTNETPFIPAN